jgi:hypothetical protein
MAALFLLISKYRDGRCDFDQWQLEGIHRHGTGLLVLKTRFWALVEPEAYRDSD